MATPLAEDFRARAKAQREAANTLLGAADLKSNAEKQIAATVGQVNATLLEALADVLDYQKAADRLSPLAARRQTILEKNNAVRIAAARGQWEEFDRLTGIAASEPTGDAPASPPGSPGAA